MGFKRGYDLSAIPAACKDNIFTYWLGGEVISQEITGTKGLVFEKQCSHFELENGIAFLRSDEYNLVLRNDGTGTVYTSFGEPYMRNTLTHNIKTVGEVTKIPGGYLSVNGEGLTNSTFVDLIHLPKGWCMLSSAYRPFTAFFERSKNTEYLQTAYEYAGDVFLKVIKGKVVCTIISSGKTFNLDCELYEQQSPYGLGGVIWTV